MTQMPAPPDAVGRVLLVNHWHDDNKGDSAITTATIRLVRDRWPEATITIASMLGRDDPAFERAFRHVVASHPDLVRVPSLAPSLNTAHVRPATVAILRWGISLTVHAAASLLGHPRRHLAREIRSADRVVLIGGSNLFDTGRVPFFGTFRLLQCTLPALAAARLDVPYTLVGHTLGPTNTRLGRALLRRVIGRASLVLVREELSAAYVRDELGLELGSRLSVAPDVAFLTECSAGARVCGLVTADLMEGGIGVLVPRPYHHHDDRRDQRLVDELVRLGRLALDTGTVRTVVVYAQCLGPTRIEDDREIARRVAAGDERFRLVELDLAPAEVAQLFSMSRFVVAVRLHAVILALSVGTPVHAIEYFTHKTRGVLASVGLAGHWSEFDTFDAEHALDKIAELTEQYDRQQLASLAASTASLVAEAGRSLP